MWRKSSVLKGFLQPTFRTIDHYLDTGKRVVSSLGCNVFRKTSWIYLCQIHASLMKLIMCGPGESRDVFLKHQNSNWKNCWIPVSTWKILYIIFSDTYWNFNAGIIKTGPTNMLIFFSLCTKNNTLTIIY